MKGIPSTYLAFFFILVFLVELISYLGILFLIEQRSRITRIYLTILYAFVSLVTTGLLLYSFANPDVIRQSRSYDFFYVVISVAFLNLFPKTFFSLTTVLSFLFRWLAGKRQQMIVLTGSLIICSGIFTVVFYGIFVGRYSLDIEKHDLYFDSLPKQLDGLTIVQLSDIHFGSFGRHPKLLDNTVKVIDEIKPDLLLFTGDLVNNFSDEIKGFEPFLYQLSAKYGKFAIQGNHDYGDYSSWPDSTSKSQNLHQIENSLTDAGFRLLLNQWERIAIKDTSLDLIGVENWGYPPFHQYGNIDIATKGIPDKGFKILMSHDPSFWNSIVVPQTDVPLTLSGHTHGGQIGIKIAGIEFSPIYFTQRYWAGLYQIGDQKLYVNRGFGTIGFTGRIDMRPEITVLTLYLTKNH